MSASTCNSCVRAYEMIVIASSAHVLQHKEPNLVCVMLLSLESNYTSSTCGTALLKMGSNYSNDVYTAKNI